MSLLYRLRGILRILAILALVLLVLGLVVWGIGLLAGWRAGLALLVAGVVFGFLAMRARRYVPRRTILEMDLERGVIECAPTGLFQRTRPNQALPLKDLVDALRRGATDKRVTGLVARIGAFRPGLAVAQEIRDAVLAFRAGGKRAVAWSETIGEGRSATVEVYVASAFDEIFVQPSGEVALDGFLLDHPFLRGAFDKVGVEPQLAHRSEYKTASNLFTEREMTPEHRESATALLDSQVEQVIEGIAEARELSADRVRALLDEGPFLAGDAKTAGLIDGVAYRDQVYDRAKATLGGRLLDVGPYLKRAGRPDARGKMIVVVPGLGQIARGQGKARRGRSGGTFGSDDVAAAIRKATRSKRVKAIVLRVDSPGGSAVASDVVWREVKRAREQGTPVVVSMGNVAASGGYYVACGADRIVAQPGTITGSIGVVWGKFYLREAYARLGITWDTVKIGEHADLWSATHRFEDAEWARVDRLIDAVYADFKARVAEGRGLSAEEVEALAKGRVWTGVQALERGLVDDLGGLTRAVDVAKGVAGIPAGAKVRVRVLSPLRRRPPWRQSESSEAAHALAETAERLAPAVEVLEQMGLLPLPEPGVRLEMR